MGIDNASADMHKRTFEFTGNLPIRVLNEVLADLPECAGAEMEGELPAGVEVRNGVNRYGVSRGVGPAYSQLFTHELVDDRDTQK